MERPVHCGVTTSGQVLLDGIRKQAEHGVQGQPVSVLLYGSWVLLWFLSSRSAGRPSVVGCNVSYKMGETLSSS